MGKIGFACDHAAVALKNDLIALVNEMGYETEDYGTHTAESVDYPDYAKKLAAGIQNGEVERGVALCGTGIGISIALNKQKSIRAALCHSEFDAVACREHNDANVLCIGARTTGVEIAKAMVKRYLETEFAGGRHANRVAKIEGGE